MKYSVLVWRGDGRAGSVWVGAVIRMSVSAITRWHWKQGMWAQHCLRPCHVLWSSQVAGKVGSQEPVFAGNLVGVRVGSKSLRCATDFLLSQGKNSRWSAFKCMFSVLQCSQPLSICFLILHHGIGMSLGDLVLNALCANIFSTKKRKDTSSMFFFHNEILPPF